MQSIWYRPASFGLWARCLFQTVDLFLAEDLTRGGCVCTCYVATAFFARFPKKFAVYIPLLRLKFSLLSDRFLSFPRDGYCITQRIWTHVSQTLKCDDDMWER